jgi:8-oxo-dGTP diphosphatase
LPDSLEHVYPRHIVAVTGVVTDEQDRLLLVKRDRRGWEPPGGQVELGEDLEAALKREVREESGCRIEVSRLVGVHSNLGRPEKGFPEQINFAFACGWRGGTPLPGDKCTGAGWFPMAEAPQQAGKLRDVLAAPPGFVCRTYRTMPYEILHERKC